MLTNHQKLLLSIAAPYLLACVAVTICVASITERYSKAIEISEERQIEHILDAQVSELAWQRYTDVVSEFARDAAQDEALRQSTASREVERAERSIENLKRRSTFTSGAVSLLGMAVYRTDGELVFGDKRVSTKLFDAGAIIVQRTGIDRLRIDVRTWLWEGRPITSVLYPMGGLRPIGYVVVHSDPMKALARLDQLLGMEVTLRSIGDGKILLKLDGNRLPAEATTLASSFSVKGPDGSPLFLADVTRDVSQRVAFLETIRWRAFLILATSLILFSIASFLLVVMLTRSIAQETAGEQCQLAVNGMTQGLVLFDKNNCISVVNNFYIQMYGLSRDVVKPGCDLRMMLRHQSEKFGQSDDIEEVANSLLKQLASGSVPPCIQELPDGRHIAITYSSIADGGWVVTHQDISDRVSKEAQIQIAMERQKAAEDASEAKSSFLAVMSHEIRTPMNAVLGFAAALLDSGLTDEQQKMAKAIHDSGDGLVAILNDILDYSKVVAGQLKLEHIAFSPQDVVENSASIAGARAAAKGLQIEKSIDPVVPPAMLGDAGRIRQIILNLVTNAIKFTESGVVSIRVSCLSTTDETATVEWTVSDTGVGISQDQIGSLFQDYAQADATISRRFGGTGLGLAICKRLVDQMGGKISIVSTVGRGTSVRFSVTLPTTRAEIAKQPQREVPDDALIGLINSRKQPLRLLVADDNETNRVVISKLLRNIPVDISYASNGLQAVSKASVESFDVIFMDMCMPEMDGLQATRAIRAKSGPCSTVPIIAFTANAFADDIAECKSAGMDDFVSKPVRKSTVIDALFRALKGSQDQELAQSGADIAILERHCQAKTEKSSGFDKDAFEELRSVVGDEGMKEAVDAFLDESASLLIGLQFSGIGADLAHITRHAHSVKGMASTFGLVRLVEVASSLEAKSQAGHGNDVSELIDQFKAAISEGRDTLINTLPKAA